MMIVVLWFALTGMFEGVVSVPLDIAPPPSPTSFECESDADDMECPQLHQYHNHHVVVKNKAGEKQGKVKLGESYYLSCDEGHCRSNGYNTLLCTEKMVEDESFEQLVLDLLLRCIPQNENLTGGYNPFVIHTGRQAVDCIHETHRKYHGIEYSISLSDTARDFVALFHEMLEVANIPFEITQDTLAFRELNDPSEHVLHQKPAKDPVTADKVAMPPHSLTGFRFQGCNHCYDNICQSYMADPNVVYFLQSVIRDSTTKFMGCAENIDNMVYCLYLYL